jgi:hypothetical protein
LKRQRGCDLTAFTGAVLAALALATAPAARCDAVAYLVNVTVRPGHNFANGDADLAYEHAICRQKQ